MKRWEVEYDRGRGIRAFEFEHEGTSAFDNRDRELLRLLHDSDAQIPLIDQPHSAREEEVQNLAAAGITVLTPCLIFDPS